MKFWKLFACLMVLTACFAGCNGDSGSSGSDAAPADSGAGEESSDSP